MVCFPISLGTHFVPLIIQYNINVNTILKAKIKRSTCNYYTSLNICCWNQQNKLQPPKVNGLVRCVPYIKNILAGQIFLVNNWKILISVNPGNESTKYASSVAGEMLLSLE